MCQCYQVGGPFIAEDPECPIHGKGGLWENGQEAREREASLEERIESLEKKIIALERTNNELIAGLNRVLEIEKDSGKILKSLFQLVKNQKTGVR